MQDEIEQHYESVAEYYEQKAQRARSRKEDRLSEYAGGSEAAQKALELFDEGYRFEVRGPEEDPNDIQHHTPVVFEVREPGAEKQCFSLNELWYLDVGDVLAGNVWKVLRGEFTVRLLEAEGRKMISVDGVPDWLKELVGSICLGTDQKVLLYLHILSKFRDEDF